MIIEKKGKYYHGDCEEHATQFYTETDTFYFHENGKIKGTFTIENGLPNGHWEQFNIDGSKKLDLYFQDGELTNKIIQ
jgi:antitoxin component YwqK of YwqJK toxin-antitoxin module